MTYLADVNVWVALAAIGHPHYEVARIWFEEPATTDLAFCRITQQGLLRLLTNPRVMGDNVLSAKRAWQIYDDFLSDYRISFLKEPSEIEDTWRSATVATHTGTNVWTDAYLCAFAELTGRTLVTFDQALVRRKQCSVRLLR